jgi:hypothetical protein
VEFQSNQTPGVSSLLAIYLFSPSCVAGNQLIREKICRDLGHSHATKENKHPLKELTSRGWCIALGWIIFKQLLTLNAANQVLKDRNGRESFDSRTT